MKDVELLSLSNEDLSIFLLNLHSVSSFKLILLATGALLTRSAGPTLFSWSGLTGGGMSALPVR